MRSAGLMLSLVFTATAITACGGSNDASSPSAPPDTPAPSQPKADSPVILSGSLSGEEDVTRAGSQTALQEYPDAAHGHTTFYVWSYKDKASATTTVMQNYVVKYLSGSSGSSVTNSRGWEYVNQEGSGVEQSVKYWDFQASAYRFFGYTGSGVTASYSPPQSAPDNVSFEITVDATASEDATTALYSKMWHKTGSQIAANVQPVTLEFIRPIARVRFMFTFVDGIAFTREQLSDISFCPTDNLKKVAKAGKVTITYPVNGAVTEESWSSNATGFYNESKDLAIDYYETPSPPVSPANSLPQTYPNSPEHWYYVLPRKSDGQDGQGSFKLTVTVGGGEPRTIIVPAEYMTWNPGYDYTYIFKITEGGGVSLDNVQVAINTWNVRASVDHPVYNW